MECAGEPNYVGIYKQAATHLDRGLRKVVGSIDGALDHVAGLAGTIHDAVSSEARQVIEWTAPWLVLARPELTAMYFDAVDLGKHAIDRCT